MLTIRGKEFTFFTMEQFQNKHITEAMAIPKERFRSWIAAGYIEPSIQKSSGRGVYNIFNRWDCYLIGLFVHLTKHGYAYQIAANIVKGVNGIDRADRDRARYIFLRFSSPKNPFGDYQELTADYSVIDLPHIFVDLKHGSFAPLQSLEVDPQSNKAEYKPELKSDQSWTDMIQVNFEQIRSGVDKALDQLPED